MRNQSRLKKRNPRIVFMTLCCCVSVVSFYFVGCAIIGVPNFLEAQTRSKVSKAKADIRFLRTALESYCIDNKEYPPDLLNLTTPVAYAMRIPLDPFSEGEVYQYFAWSPDKAIKARYYVVWSVGPDGNNDTTRDSILERFGRNPPRDRIEWFSRFCDVMYDPTNGMKSRGDIFGF